MTSDVEGEALARGESVEDRLQAPQVIPLEKFSNMGREEKPWKVHRFPGVLFNQMKERCY